MKNIKKRILAIVLLAVMVFSNLPTSTALAMEDSTTQKTESEHLESDAVLEAGNRLNYILVESPYLEAPNMQNIVVSWGDGTEQISNMRITVQKEDGTTEEWICSNQSSYLYVFSKEYTDKNEQSTYKVTDIRFVENEKEQRFLLSELGVEAEFGVNKAYDGIEELQPLNPEDAQAIDTSVVTIDENGETKAQEDIESALNAVTKEMGMAAGARTAEKAGEIVVALDPGHDNKHGGTSGSGLTEQGLTLKIANYAKAELETYNGVKVYMTRTSASCPYPETGSSGACIEKRVQAAAGAGAKIYVSLHLNSGSASANGAEVIIPNTSWKPELSTQGKELAQKILDELAAVGLNKRPTPIYSKDTTVGEKYPDGSISDYFAVQIYAKEKGIPGIIVEHAFLSNANDVNNFLKTEEGLKKLGVADATGIAKYLGLSKDKDGWVTIDGEVYYYENNQKVYGEKWIGGERYYFALSTGAMHRGWRVDGNKIYYYASDGKMVKGHQKIEGSNYYFDLSSGTVWKGWVIEGSKIYYFGSDGKMVKGHQKIEGSNYYFDLSSGTVWKGWVIEGEKIYYFGSDGKMVTGYKTIDGKEYYFDPVTGECIKNLDSVFYKIEGKNSVTVNQMVKYFQKSGKKYPKEALEKGGAATIEEFCKIFYEEAETEGIRVEVAFAQSMKETGFLQFGGDVKVEQFNFAGLGATGNSEAGADFSNYGKQGVRMGVRAQMQHLKCYANDKPLKNECVDPRWGNWLRKKAPYVEWLGINENPYKVGWATDKKYGYSIRKMISDLQAI
ncbi:MAG: N-acetylmuramoyl-L-alanine amidase [Faecalimonas sp.]|nr:N-acetylmuramoyl-L-alanine amidase [Faecalimonas sp.]